MNRMEAAIARGQELGRLALYFGCHGALGHYLHSPGGSVVRRSDLPDFPWDDGLMDTGLLDNGKHQDVCDGKVWWTCGGQSFWYAFFWWDRSGDRRMNSNSGLYVRGFGWPEIQEAFDYGCAQFPEIVKRQHHALVLQEPHPKAPIIHAGREALAQSQG